MCHPKRWFSIVFLIEHDTFHHNSIDHSIIIRLRAAPPAVNASGSPSAQTLLQININKPCTQSLKIKFLLANKSRFRNITAEVGSIGLYQATKITNTQPFYVMGYLAITIYKHVFCPLKPPQVDWLICLHGDYDNPQQGNRSTNYYNDGELHNVSPLNPIESR